MITESFLNSCFSLILCKKTNVKRTKGFYRDILEILNFQNKNESLKMPVLIENKAECLGQICKMLIEDKTINSIIDSISFSQKFNQFQSLFNLNINEELKDIVSADILKQIRLRKKINTLFQNYDDLNNVLSSIKDGSFNSLDNLIEDYEVTIKKLYSNITESNRFITIEAAASLDLVKDSYTNVIDMIQKKYDRSNKTSTGFSILDNNVLFGGFEPSRLYIFGGGSGAGKSTILNNLIIKSAINESSNFIQTQQKKVYIYITLENTIEEALLRTYQPLFNQTTVQVLQDISNGIDIKKRMVDELLKNNSIIVMKYFPAMSISTIDIMGIIDDIKEEYSEDLIAGVYIDYLDLLKSDLKYDIYRMELGHITLSLKTMAVQYNIPVITGTQLGRSSYRIDQANSLNLDQIAESIKKVEHSDFVCLLAKDSIDKTKVYGKIGKNRAGPANISIDFKVDFERFKFLNGVKASNEKKQDNASNSQLMTFSGSFSGMEASI